jgi:cell division protein FtsW (lipid II flippase)
VSEDVRASSSATLRGICGWLALTQTCGFLLVLGAQASAGRSPAAGDLGPLLWYFAALSGTALFFSLVKFQGDPALPGAALALAGLGLLAQFRMGALEGAGEWRPWLFVGGPAAMALVFTALRGGRLAGLERFGGLAALASLALVAGILLTGQRFRGAVFAAGQLTPTELLKILVVLHLAATLVRRREALSKPTWWGLLPAPSAWFSLAAYWGLLCGLLLLQRDLGMALILSAVLAAMLLLATGRMRYLLVTLAAAGGAGWLAWDRLAHSQRRFQAWLDPFADPTGSGWQILQGLSGMFAGGLWGAGPGQGNPERIPIAASDFIYAVIGEEFGYAGCLLVVAIYLVFFQRGFRVARTCPRLFEELLVGGLMAVFAVQTFVNLGGVTKAIPLTGVTLPFISQGGSSFLISFVSLGLVLAASEPPPARRRGGRK